MPQEEYRRKRTTADEEAARIRSGDTVYLACGCLLPVDFAAALYRAAPRLRNVKVLNYLPLEPLALLSDPDCGEAFDVCSIFYNKFQQSAQALGRCSFLPTHLRNAARDLGCAAESYDCMVLTVSPMDRHGYFSLAGSAGIELAMLPRARRLVVEVASHAPRIFGNTMLHISQVDAVLESDRYPCVLPSEIPDEADRQLGQVVAGLVEDGDTIQLGFGGTINALASELKGKRHLGIHTEALSDAGMELLRSGAADNSRKTLHPGRTVTCFTMGSQALYDFIDDNPAFLHKTLSYTNNPSVLAAHPGMTSINAALQIDLTGQCASEGLGTRHISGSGGQVDTSVGAQMAPGGKSIITLRSTYQSRDPNTGETRIQSRILPVLPQGAAVTLTRTNTHFVATEYGAVCLRGLTIPQRARALIRIAHPDFRPWLEDAFERQYHQRLPRS